MGQSLFGGGTSKINSVTNSNTSSNNNQTGTSQPADFQMPYILQGLQAAAKNYGNSAGFQPLAYTGLSPGSKEALSRIAGFGNSSADYAPGIMGAGAGLLGNGASASGAANAAFGGASGDPTAGVISAASRYADNPYTRGMITAAQTPIERQLKEVALPGLNASGAATGNLDSSRSAMAEAILRRSAGEDESNIASNILGSQYNNGLNLAEGARTSNLSALLGSASALGGLTRTGADLIGSGANLGQNGLSQAFGASTADQTDANASNKVAYDNAMAASQYPWAQLGSFWDIAGHPLGQTSTSTGSSTGTNVGTTNGTQTQPGPGVLGGLLGLGTGIGSFFTPTGAFGLGPSLFSQIKNAF
jgi:hypothetical protein